MGKVDDSSSNIRIVAKSHSKSYPERESRTDRYLSSLLLLLLLLLILPASTLYLYSYGTHLSTSSSFYHLVRLLNNLRSNILSIKPSNDRHSSSSNHHSINRSISFDYLKHLFVQSSQNYSFEDPHNFDVYGSNSSFGLIDSSSNDRWKNFQSEIDQIIRNQPTNVAHIVLFIARHGQGYHNVAESKYGTPLWDCYWSEINGDGNLTWGPDARLTELGQEQARVAGLAWSREIEDGLPIPQLFISSPLSRALYTMELTGAYKHSNQTPIVKEHWRENIGLHTCDKRRTKSIILGDFRFVRFEDGFSEDDDFWTPDLQETDLQLDVRIRGALGDLFLVSTESNITYISITAHSGVISSLLRVIGHRPFPIQTGGMIPLVIKATTTATRTRPPSPGPSATKPNCPNY